MDSPRLMASAMRASEQVQRGPATMEKATVTIRCFLWSRRRPGMGIPRRTETYNKAKCELELAELEEQALKLIDEHRLPRKKFRRGIVLEVDDDGTRTRLTHKNTSSLLAGLCDRARSVSMDLSYPRDSESESSSEEESRERNEERLVICRRQLGETQQQKEEALRQRAALQSKLEDVEATHARTEERLTSALAALEARLRAKALFIVVDGNLSSRKGPFLRHLKEILGPDGVQVLLRLDDDWLHNLVALYKLTKDPESTGGPEGEENKALAWEMQRLMMTYDLRQMYMPRIEDMIVEQSIWPGEFVFRPTHHDLNNILTRAQLEECTERFNKAVQERGLPDLFIRLCVKPAQSLQRIQRKGSREEKDVTEDYLEALEKRFETDYKAAIEEKGGIVIELTVDKEDESEATPEELLQELKDKLRLLQFPRADELRRLFKVLVEPPHAGLTFIPVD